MRGRGLFPTSLTQKACWFSARPSSETTPSDRLQFKDTGSHRVCQKSTNPGKVWPLAPILLFLKVKQLASVSQLSKIILQDCSPQKNVPKFACGDTTPFAGVVCPRGAAAYDLSHILHHVCSLASSCTRLQSGSILHRVCSLAVMACLAHLASRLQFAVL